MTERVSDPLDRVVQLEEAERAAMVKVKRPTLQRVGRCHFCNEPIASGFFCDTDCESDYARLTKQQETSGKRRP